MHNNRNKGPFEPWRQGPNGPEHDFWTAGKSLNDSLWIGVGAGCLVNVVIWTLFIGLLAMADSCGA